MSKRVWETETQSSTVADFEQLSLALLGQAALLCYGKPDPGSLREMARQLREMAQALMPEAIAPDFYAPHSADPGLIVAKYVGIVRCTMASDSELAAETLHGIAYILTKEASHYKRRTEPLYAPDGILEPLTVIGQLLLSPKGTEERKVASAALRALYPGDPLPPQEHVIGRVQLLALGSADPIDRLILQLLACTMKNPEESDALAWGLCLACEDVLRSENVY